ncbi:MAG: hypothetical protein ACE5FH_00200 [Candidatus Zixiibacteriota bacterium]
MGDVKSRGGHVSRRLWLIYVAMLLAGVMVLAHSFGWTGLDRWTARLGIALVYSALALSAGRGKWVGSVATGIIWLPTVVFLLV